MHALCNRELQFSAADGHEAESGSSKVPRAIAYHYANNCTTRKNEAVCNPHETLTIITAEVQQSTAFGNKLLLAINKGPSYYY